MWVSTAMAGTPKAVFSTTLAVLRPTPGRRCSASRSRGTSPPCSSTRSLDRAMTFFAFMLKKPRVRIASTSLVSPNASIFCGVSTLAKRGRVALFTPTSVDCAESTTATSSV